MNRLNIDIENAIEDLKGLNERSSKESELFKERHGRNFDLAIETLEKQIPKKPLDTDEGWLCPNCKRHIQHEQQLMHCRQCGQLVVWR